MSWAEFSTLLAGIMPKTPLGQVISIRSEEDENMLKNFTKEHHEIRNAWRNKQIAKMSEEEKKEKVNEVMEMFKNAFG